MAKLTAASRRRIPKGKFGLPGQGKGPSGTGAGSYPMPDKKHAAVAKGYAKRFASPAQRAKIDAKANRILGESPAGLKKVNV